MTTREVLLKLVEVGHNVLYYKDSITDWENSDPSELFSEILIEQGLDSEEYQLYIHDLGHEVEFILV